MADAPWREWLRDVPWGDLEGRWAAAGSGAVWQARDDFRAEQVDRKTHTLALGPSGSLELRNISGPVSVVAGSGKDVTIESSGRRTGGRRRTRNSAWSRSRPKSITVANGRRSTPGTRRRGGGRTSP
jgi:hypothetical protein